MQLSVTGDSQRTVVTLSGDLDVSTAGEFRDALYHAIDGSSGPLIVDLTGVGFLDSTTLGVLVGAHKRLIDRGGLQLICPRAALLRIFTLTGLDKVFAMHSSLAAVPD